MTNTPDPGAVLEGFRKSLGVNAESGVSEHYFNELQHVISRYDIINSGRHNEGEKESARQSISGDLGEIIPYRDFLVEQVERCNANNMGDYEYLKEQLGDKISSDPPQELTLEVTLSVLTAANTDELDKITQELKSMATQQDLDHTRVKQLLYEGAAIIYGKVRAEVFKQRLLL